MPDASTALPRRPRLKPGLRRLWRATGALQIGLDPRHAVVIEDMTAEATTFLDHLDGTTATEDLARVARESGLDPLDATALVRRLAGHGVLEDAAGDGRSRRRLSEAERERLGPDLAAWSIGVGSAGDGDTVLERRRRARVDVHGAGRIGAQAAALLAHAGIGEVRVLDREPFRASDRPATWLPATHGADGQGEGGAAAEPAEVEPAEVEPAPARTRGEVTLERCERLVPSLRTGRRRPRGLGAANAERADVVLLAPVDTTGAVDLELRDALLRDSVPHLPAYVRETVGVVGPFVVPGRTACLRCVDLSRSERDPSWPRLLAQVSPPPGPRRRRPPPPDPCDGVLAAAVAALAAVQVLARVDGHRPATWGAALELDPADGATRPKRWEPHPACGCHWN